MKELKDYTIGQLRNEISRQERILYEDERSRIPKEYLPYKEVDGFKHNNRCKYFSAQINDGAEGFDFLIQYNYRKDEYDHAGADDELIHDTVRHAYLNFALEGGWDANLEDINIYEIGEYGISLYTIDATNRPEEDDY